MGKKQSKLIILILLAALTCLLVYWPVEYRSMEKKKSLKSTLSDIKGYRLSTFQPLSDIDTNMLKLDDYIQARYVKYGEKEIVDLYVGYYYSLEKLTAPHHPLVCFPSQGWQVTTPAVRKIDIGENSISYSTVEAKLGGQNLLVLYWFQAGEKTALNIRKNKLNAIFNRFSGRSNEHAFVRLVVPILSVDEDAIKVGEDFMRSFYPVFLQFIKQ